MHPLLIEALAEAHEWAQCDASSEPPFDDLRRALLADKPSPADAAHIGEVLQLTWLLLDGLQEATVRTLQWAELAAKAVGQARRPAVRLTAEFEATRDSPVLRVFLESDDLAPAVWNSQDSPLNTVLLLRGEDYVFQTAPVYPKEHWALQQLRYQACGVFSTGLTRLIAALRTVVDVELRTWPVYRKEADGLQLQLSDSLIRAGLALRRQVTALHDAKEAAHSQALEALQRVSIASFDAWQGLCDQADKESRDLRELVRAQGASQATKAQLQAVQAALERLNQAVGAAEEGEAALGELRSLRTAARPKRSAS